MPAIVIEAAQPFGQRHAQMNGGGSRVEGRESELTVSWRAVPASPQLCPESVASSQPHDDRCTYRNHEPSVQPLLEPRLHAAQEPTCIIMHLRRLHENLPCFSAGGFSNACDQAPRSLLPGLRFLPHFDISNPHVLWFSPQMSSSAVMISYKYAASPASGCSAGPITSS